MTYHLRHSDELSALLEHPGAAQPRRAAPLAERAGQSPQHAALACQSVLCRLTSDAPDAQPFSRKSRGLCKIADPSPLSCWTLAQARAAPELSAELVRMTAGIRIARECLSVLSRQTSDALDAQPIWGKSCGVHYMAMTLPLS